MESNTATQYMSVEDEDVLQEAEFARFETEFFQDVVCCNIRMKDLYALLEHCDEFHPSVPCSAPLVLPALNPNLSALPTCTRLLIEEFENDPPQDIQAVLNSIGFYCAEQLEDPPYLPSPPTAPLFFSDDEDYFIPLRAVGTTI